MQSRTCSISSVDSVSYLGLTIDRNLKWDRHIIKLAKKLRSLLSLFRPYMSPTDIDDLKMVYHGLVDSQLWYGLIAWKGAYNHLIAEVAVLQRWMLKIFHEKTKRFPTNELYNISQVPNIKELHFLFLLTRYKLKVHKDLTKNLTLRSHISMGPRLFNKIPTEICRVNSIEMFRGILRKWLRESKKHRAALPVLIANYLVSLENLSEDEYFVIYENSSVKCFMFTLCDYQHEIILIRDFHVACWFALHHLFPYGVCEYKKPLYTYFQDTLGFCRLFLFELDFIFVAN